MKTWTEAELRTLIQGAAQRHGVDPRMLFGQLKHESDNFSPDVLEGKRKSSAGAVGIAQFMPATAAGLGVNPLDIPQAVDGAAKYMSQLTQQFGSEDVARLAYNWGPGNIRRWIRNGADPAKLPAETRQYPEFVAQAAGQQPLPPGVTPSTAGAGRGSVNPDREAMLAAAQEIAAGLPPGGASAPAALPTGGDSTAAAAGGDWRAALPTGGGQGMAAAPGVDFAELLQDRVAEQQNAMLAGVFAGTEAAAPVDTQRIPGAVDRYLDKLLA